VCNELGWFRRIMAAFCSRRGASSKITRRVVLQRVVIGVKWNHTIQPVFGWSTPMSLSSGHSTNSGVASSPVLGISTVA